MTASQGKEKPGYIDPMTERRVRNETLFKKYVVPFMSATESPKVLSVGCGFADETGGLLRIFPNMHFLGIDVGGKSVEDGRRFNEDLVGDIEFRNQDIHDPKTVAEGPWDLVIIRHPQVEGSPESTMADIFRRAGDASRAEIFDVLGTTSLKTEGTKATWEKVIDKALEVATEGGVVFVSTWFPWEIDRVRKMIEGKSDVEVVIDEQNQTITDDFGNDKFVIVAKKK